MASVMVMGGSATAWRATQRFLRWLTPVANLCDMAELIPTMLLDAKVKYVIDGQGSQWRLSCIVSSRSPHVSNAK